MEPCGPRSGTECGAGERAQDFQVFSNTPRGVAGTVWTRVGVAGASSGSRMKGVHNSVYYRYDGEKPVQMSSNGACGSVCAALVLYREVSDTLRIVCVRGVEPNPA